MSFKDRIDAGRQLGQLLIKYKDQNCVVLALPRGGVVIGAEIAKCLHAPLGLIFAHKLGHPYQPEYAIGAVSESGHLVGNAGELQAVGKNWIENEKKHQMEEIKRRRLLYLKGKKEIDLKDKVAIIVDDGIATGLTLEVGILELQDRHPLKIVAAVPVSPKGRASFFKSKIDDFVSIETPEDYRYLGAVGAYFQIFDQVEDDEVIRILEESSKVSGVK